MKKNPNTRPTRLTVYGLSDQELALARACARDQERSLSNLVKHALTGYLSRYGYKLSERL